MIDIRVRVVRVAASAVLAIAPLVVACAQGDWRADRARRGDTSMVRTLSGSVWGNSVTLVPEIAIGSADGADPLLFGSIRAIDVDSAGNIYVLEGTAREVRVFSPSGRHLRTFGRRGQGPGEFENPQTLAVTADGRAIVRDNSGRISVFTPRGVYTNSWNTASGFATNARFYLTAAGRLLNPTFRDRYVWYGLDGKAYDTIPTPRRGADPPQLVIVRGGGRATYSIPYQPYAAWTVTRDGRFVVGHGARYEIDVALANGGVLRIARDVKPVPVPAAEAARRREVLLNSIRRGNDPDFVWNGPPIPSTKPLFNDINAGRDGTVWVIRSGPSREEKNDDWDPRKPEVGSPTNWVSSDIADAFDVDGRFLGTVAAPKGMSFYPSPVLRADKVWAVAEHADGFPQVVRYRVEKR